MTVAEWFKRVEKRVQENGSGDWTICFTFNICTYSESSFTALKVILNNHSIILDGFVRKTHQSSPIFQRYVLYPLNL